MKLVVWVLAVFVLWAVGSPSLAGAGNGCCICTGCSPPPATCAGAGLSCDVGCMERGCSAFSMGTPETCDMLPSCAPPPSLIVNPAPTASTLGLALVAAGLVGLGARRLARDRRRRRRS